MSLIFDQISLLSDPLRCRLVAVLEREELSVSEICAVLQVPQSTASRHLKQLADAGWVSARREGTSRRYTSRLAELDADAVALWELIRGKLEAGATAKQDLTRLRATVAERRQQSQEFFSTAAREWSDLRRDLFGTSPDLYAMAGLLDPSWTVADLGTGTGQIAAFLAPFVERVIAVDESEAMLAAAHGRLSALDNVENRPGELEALPIEEHSLDAAIASLVLHHLGRPGQVIAEAARCLKPGGRLLLIDMQPHEREEYRQSMGHVWLGFDEEQIGDWLHAAGLGSLRYQPLPVDPAAKGPALFVASAVASDRPVSSRAARETVPVGA